MSALANAALLDIGGLRLGYGRNDVIHGISITVPKGAIVSLIGANGAGKTTILRGLSGLIKPRAGTITFKGEALAGRSAHRIARTGLVHVPEGRQVFAEMTVAENLAMGAYRIGRPSDAIRERILTRFPRLRERLNQRAGLMSGGEQQMLAIGRALMTNPRVLLMDEPSEGLAPQIVAEVGRIIAQLKGQGLSIVLVEQDIKLTLALADEIAIINTGAVVFSGTPAELRADESIIAQHLGVF